MTNSHHESPKYEYEAEDCLTQLEAAIDALNLVIEAYFDTPKVADATLVYLAIQARDHTQALRRVMFPNAGGC